MARINHKQKDGFSGIPRRIIEHPSFKSLGYSARSLLIQLGYQYRGKNNGNLVITWSLMKDGLVQIPLCIRLEIHYIRLDL